MQMSGEFRVPADRQAVWQSLNDPEVLKACLPGCEEIEKTSDTAMRAKITAKVGPVRAKLSGSVTLSDLDPPNSYTLTGKGQGPVGFASGAVKVVLSEADGQTVVHYDVDAKIGGKLAQIGSRLIDSSAKKLAGEFFDALAEQLRGAQPAPAEARAEAPAPVPPAASRRGLPTWTWATGVIIIAVILILAFSGVL